MKLDWIISFIHIVFLPFHVLATRLGHWSAYDSCDDVLQMVAPMVGYRAISPGGWVGNSTRVGFKFFTISGIRSSFGRPSFGWVRNSIRRLLQVFLQFPAKVEMASSPVRGITPLLRQTYLMSLKCSRGFFKYFCSMTTEVSDMKSSFGGLFNGQTDMIDVRLSFCGPFTFF